jgi:hypothetical protein
MNSQFALTTALVTLAACSSPSDPTQAEIPASADEPRLTVEDFAAAFGTDWAGTLTYLDYGSGERVSISVTAALAPAPQTAEGEAISVTVGYPDEPQYDSTSVIVLRDGGHQYGDQQLIARKKSGDLLEYSTSASGEDADRSASFRFDYVVSTCLYSVAKNVTFDGEAETFERNRYELTPTNRPECAGGQ